MPETKGSLSAYPALAKMFSSTAAKLEQKHHRLAEVFCQCFPNTLETTAERQPDGSTFVFTGDISAMWLRDSSAQMRPYVPFAKEDSRLAEAVRGLIRRQALYLTLDPYANAFNRTPSGEHYAEDRTEMGPWVWERKFELDSLCYPVQLLQDYWAATSDLTIFDTAVYAMLVRIVETMEIEQNHGQRSSYSFERPKAPTELDTLPFNGRGRPVNETGLIWSGFRPSDDRCQYGYHIPSNMFARVVLGYLANFAQQMYHDPSLAFRAERLARGIDDGLRGYALVYHPRFGNIYAYEVDGFGNHVLMDDANVPSLLSLPYLGYCAKDDPTYLRTRAFVLSVENPYYSAGMLAQGVGSPHTPPGNVWPIGLIMQGLTSTELEEQLHLLDVLVSTTAGTHFMHESFDPDQPEQFTRAWFAWANSLFSQYVLELQRNGALKKMR